MDGTPPGMDAARPESPVLGPGAEGRWNWLWWLLAVAAVWLWFCSVSVAALERVQTLRMVEGYGLAVFDQLVWNYSHTGQFRQTIHFGYADSWMWSGHRSPWLFVVSWLYGLAPGPVTLCRIQIAAVALGGLPAFGLGWRVFRTPLGGLAALGLYLAYPPTTILALNDYQDVVLGIPFALAAVHQAWRGSSRGYILALLGMAAAREEWVTLAPFLGLMAPGDWRQRRPWVVRGVGVALVYAGALWVAGWGYVGHDNPMMSHAGGAHGGLRMTRTWRDFTGFYLHFFLPVHLVAVFSPLALVPAAGALAVHLTAPLDAGVDTDWGGHIHHMAPVAASIVLAAILALGYCYRRTCHSRGMWILLLLGGLLLSARVDAEWARRLGLHLQFRPIPGVAVLPAPEWALVARVPADARIATDTWAAPVVSSRPTSYTYDDSFRDKVGGRGLRAVDYLLVRKAHTDWVREARRHTGAELLGETRDYLLFRMPWAVCPAADEGLSGKDRVGPGHRGQVGETGRGRSSR